ncbi:MAG TPA: uridine diphosphate-N-acetylglucosamine-binding protein YvcK, partial [Terriglobales bacterium]|nr:uridine diphosphate-N-acetylglucosamine-binding protein YvcK [Terriglobales bacterium]
SEDEALMARLFQFRFSAGVGLEGHNFGNLFLTALANLRGDFAEAVKVSSQILKTRGDIVPSTTSDVQLTAQMADGTTVRGETRITASKSRILKLEMEPANAAPLPSTLEEIAAADLITIGPGSLFTSLIPNLLVHGIPEAIRASKGLKVYVGNLMTQANESLGMSASQHVEALFQHAGGKFFDYALLNRTAIPAEMIERYKAEGAEPIAIDADAVRALGVEPVLGDYLGPGEQARHNAGRIAQDLMQLLSERNRAEPPHPVALKSGREG